MKLFIALAALTAGIAHAQVDFDGMGGGIIQNPISNSIISTTDMLRVYGRISSTAPSVSGAMVYKTNSGLVQTATSSYVSNTGTPNEGLISLNVTALNGLVIPTAVAGVTPTAGDLVKTASGVVCIRTGGVFKNLGLSNVTTALNLGSLLGSGTSSPTNCVF